jgi:hypothetical protein
MGGNTYFRPSLSDTPAGSLARSYITEDSLARYQIELMKCRNADGTVMDATGAAGNFKISAGGWGSGSLTLLGEAAQGNTKTDTLAFEFALAPEYIADQDAKIIVQARYAGSGTAGAKTIDLEGYELSDAGVATSIRASSTLTLTASFADYTFALTDTNLTAGDRIMLLVRSILEETGGSSSLQVEIGNIEVQLDIKG